MRLFPPAAPTKMSPPEGLSLGGYDVPGGTDVLVWQIIKKRYNCTPGMGSNTKSSASTIITSTTRCTSTTSCKMLLASTTTQVNFDNKISVVALGHRLGCL